MENTQQIMARVKAESKQINYSALRRRPWTPALVTTAKDVIKVNSKSWRKNKKEKIWMESGEDADCGQAAVCRN